jgi:hypothetical protein
MKINMHTSHPSAFISSTFIDLYEDRIQIANTLKARGLNVNALDIRPASTQSSRKEILNGIKESDFVILLIGDRFGSIMKSMTGSESQSITWWEYVSAQNMGKPVIAYFKNFDSSNPNSHDNRNEATYNKKRKLFDRFKGLVTQRHNPAYYSDPNDLADKLDNSLISIYRAGVKTLNSSNSELRNKVSQLEAEVNRLKPNVTLPSFQSTTPTLGGLADVFSEKTKVQPQFGIADFFNKK